jgi:hypothetical protein
MVREIRGESTARTRCPRVDPCHGWLTSGGDQTEIFWEPSQVDVGLPGRNARGSQAFADFLEKHQLKCPAACECRLQDRAELLVFHVFPAEHGRHLGTTNPTESTFASIRLRQGKTKGNGNRRASLTIRFKLTQSATKRFRCLNGHEQLSLILQGIRFVDGILSTAAS